MWIVVNENSSEWRKGTWPPHNSTLNNPSRARVVISNCGGTCGASIMKRSSFVLLLTFPPAHQRPFWHPPSVSAPGQGPGCPALVRTVPKSLLAAFHDSNVACMWLVANHKACKSQRGDRKGKTMGETLNDAARVSSLPLQHPKPLAKQFLKVTGTSRALWHTVWEIAETDMPPLQRTHL